MGSFLQDVRYSLRKLRQAGWFTITVVLMLAFGIGATATIFSLIEGILLRPLPFRDPGRLVQLGEHVGNNPGIGVTARDILAYTAAGSAFASMGGVTATDFELAGNSFSEDVPAARLTAGVFPTLGVAPLLGRVFTAQEDEGRAPVAVISYALWTNRYHRDPHIAGTSISLDRKNYTILGVMPRDFEFPVQPGRLNQAQVWVPMSFTPDELSEQNAGVWGFQMVARLKDAVTVPAAAQDADRVARDIMRHYPASMANIKIRGDAQLLSEIITGDARPLLRVLLIAVVVVLLIACANVAILMLVRAIRSHRDYAVRIALGVRPSAILRETLIEAILLSLAGGALGLAFASAALRIALRLLPETMPRMNAVSIDATVALFDLGIALAVGMLCSFAPAFVALRTNLMASLRETMRTGSGGSSHARMRSTLVIAEIAVALVLLIVSGAFLRSYQKMLAIDPGFRPEHVVVGGYQLPLTKYPTDAAVAAFSRSILDRLSSQPAILAAGLGNTLPSSGNSGLAGYTLEGERSEGWKLKFAAFGAIQGNYFQALGIPLLAGRFFTDQDRADAPLVILVSQSMAQHCWPGQSAIGKRMHAGNPKKNMPWATVVGVVGNTRIGARDTDGNDQWYVPAEQPAILFAAAADNTRTRPAAGFLVVRAALSAPQMIDALRATVAEVDPVLALQPVQSMSDVLSKTEAPRLFMTEWVGAFALAALGLAITGIYAVMSFSVSLRTQEIAIRMALGAQRDGIARLVLGSGAKLAMLGSGFGVVAALAASRLVRSYLFGVPAIDPWIYAGSVLLILGMALLGSALPALRAASAEPTVALRAGQ
jgi:predicted permease